MGEIWYPTSRSSTRRACCASYMSRFSSSGFWIASWIAFLVISLNNTRCVGTRLRAIWCLTCQAMASPSRSGSVASSTRSAFFAAAFSSVTTFCLPLMIS